MMFGRRTWPVQLKVRHHSPEEVQFICSLATFEECLSSWPCKFVIIFVCCAIVFIVLLVYSDKGDMVYLLLKVCRNTSEIDRGSLKCTWKNTLDPSEMNVGHPLYFHVCILRCGVSVWYGEYHPVYRPHAEEEDHRPSPSDWSIVGVHKVHLRLFNRHIVVENNGTRG